MQKKQVSLKELLIIADKGSYVSYLRGLHSPAKRYKPAYMLQMLSLIALENAEIKYSTVQNWYPGNEDGKGGIYNFVTKRGIVQG